MDSEWLSEMLDIEPITTRLPATDSRIVELEKHIGVELPSEYRDFLSRFGGSWVKGIAPISEPTPFGDATIESFYGFIDGKPRSCDLKFQSDLAQGAPVAIPIAGGAFGCQTFIIGDDNPTLGVSRGSVYFWDCDNRSAWPEAEFKQRFGILHTDIRKYLELRNSGTLPSKPQQLADFYKIADSFEAFAKSIVPSS